MMPSTNYESRLSALEVTLASLAANVRVPAPVVTTWVPQLYQNGNRTSTVVYSRYYVLGKYAFVQVKLTCTAVGTAGNAVTVTGIPAAIAPVNFDATLLAACGSGIVRRAAITNYDCTLSAASATDFQFITGANNGQVGVLPNFALANTDTISLVAVYEIA